MKRTQQEKELLMNSIGTDVYIRTHITNIKRDPKCPNEQNADFPTKVQFFEKVRSICRDLVAEQEFSNAKTLYSRCISLFKNMPKRQKENLTEEEKAKKNEVLNILFLNVSLCLLKKKMYKDCIKNAEEALTYVQQNPKAHYRIAMAYKANNDFDRAKTSLGEAIKLAPNDSMLREEYK